MNNSFLQIAVPMVLMLTNKTIEEVEPDFKEYLENNVKDKNIRDSLKKEFEEFKNEKF
ncbi:MAG: hypothetical protein II453_10065 [Alphaproteobacteria bacterium]|nr:hypothetical protein [Alphaproteobacteria bacterium]MBQ3946334.1 hypothetical protein [Alphaproteobacteria bacterium]